MTGFFYGTGEKYDTLQKRCFFPEKKIGQKKKQIFFPGNKKRDRISHQIWFIFAHVMQK